MNCSRTILRGHGIISSIVGVAMTTILLAAHCFNTKITTALTTTTQATRTIPFQDFRFAPNNVCVSPQYFVAVRDGDADNNNSNGNSDTTDISNQQNKSYSYFTMRNVPGDGDCMFLAVALAAATSMGLGGSNKLLQEISRQTREVVAQVLSSPTGKLFIGPDKDNVVDASRLLQSAVLQEPAINTTEDYLAALRKEGREGGLYGGGPELAVLSNVLRRPISIYEVDETRLKQQQQQQQQQQQHEKDCSGENGSTNGNETSSEILFPIVCKGSFGEGVFEDPCLTSIPDSVILANMQPGAYSWRLHILILDASPTERHACVLLPQRIHI